MVADSATVPDALQAEYANELRGFDNAPAMGWASCAVMAASWAGLEPLPTSA